MSAQTLPLAATTVRGVREVGVLVASRRGRGSNVAVGVRAAPTVYPRPRRASAAPRQTRPGPRLFIDPDRRGSAPTVVAVPRLWWLYPDNHHDPDPSVD